MQNSFFEKSKRDFKLASKVEAYMVINFLTGRTGRKPALCKNKFSAVGTDS